MNNIYAIIPARLGSKRLKEKNIVKINNKPLIMWTIDEALKSKYIGSRNLYVSTEAKKIKDIVIKKCNIIDRPKNLAGDLIWTQDVIDHAMSKINITNKDDDIIVILQANSPQIDSITIDRCIDKLITENLWEVHTVDQNYINNGAIHVIRAKVCRHIGKANYNGVVKTDWIDVHTKEDLFAVKNALNI